MEKRSSTNRKRRARAGRPRIPPSRLEAMIEEAIVDAYTESEQAGGLHVMLEQEARAPLQNHRPGRDGLGEAREHHRE